MQLTLRRRIGCKNQNKILQRRLHEELLKDVVPSTSASELPCQLQVSAVPPVTVDLAIPPAHGSITQLRDMALPLRLRIF